MSDSQKIRLGDAIFNNIDDNDFLNVLYDNMLYNYAILKLHLEGLREPRNVDVNAALRFADLLSKSTHETKADEHKMWAQEIVTILMELYPDNEDVSYYAGSVLASVGNFRGMENIETQYKESSLQEKAYAIFCEEYLTVPAETGKKFFIPQKNIYDKLESHYFSYSAPTSMGKSFIMEMFIKDRVMNGAKMNFARIVPTKALINEVRKDTIDGLDKLLEEMNYSVVTAASDYSLEEEHNFILVMTPERLLYLLISKPEFKLDYIFIDEAHKLTGKNSRAPFYYKIVDMLARQKPNMPHFVFASPNIPNPEVYLKLVTEAERGTENALSSTFAPVSQFKFLISDESKSIRIFNDHTQDSIFVCKYGNDSMSVVDFMNIMTQFDRDKPLLEKKRNLAYFSGKDAAINAARQYAVGKPEIDDDDLKELANDIRDQVHGEYFLTQLIRQGIAYHIGYLPSSIRQRIERLFKDGKITAMFCTSTLIEGVNLPADNLFITNYRSGRPPMTSVEFRNLIGRVGRIKFNLYGNVFFISDGNAVKEKEFVELLREPIPEQRLSVVQDLKPKLKKHVVDTFLSGSSKIEPYNTKSQKQSEEEYVMMRKFGLILLQDIMDDRDSLVRREFAQYMPPNGEEIIRQKFEGQRDFIDNDINISADQTRRLAAAIRNGTHYPEVKDGKFSHAAVLGFLEELSGIFNWDKYEFKTLGKRNRNGEHAKLSWYAVILSQWMEGHGLNYIMRQAINHMTEHPDRFWLNDYTPSYFEGTPEHKNIVFADTLEVIENIILFSISNYFLRFSNMYKSIHGEHSLDDNNWYEFVEYGTTNELTVFLQRNGFSREPANYIKDNPKYLVKTDEGWRLHRSLLKCPNNDAKTEAEIIDKNRPGLFVNEEDAGSTI